MKMCWMEISSLGLGFIIVLPAGFETGTVNIRIRQGEITHFLSWFNSNFRFPNIGSNYFILPGIDWHGSWAIKGERIERWIWERNTIWTSTAEISRMYRVHLLIPKLTNTCYTSEGPNTKYRRTRSNAGYIQECLNISMGGVSLNKAVKHPQWK